MSLIGFSGLGISVDGVHMASAGFYGVGALYINIKE